MLLTPSPEVSLSQTKYNLVFLMQKFGGSSALCDVDALVARHPACRASEIQRVHVVQNPKLAHLRDVVVFPARGYFPLASKPQGGDYDGDTSWICWEPALVDSFRNVPPPAESPEPAKFNIMVDDRKLAYFQEWGDFEARFLKRNFELQLQENLLGTCTNFLKRVRYTVGNMHHRGVLDLADVHDLLVDSSKNGYSFTEENWAM